jgi:RNA recognition motif-containing protein
VNKRLHVGNLEYSITDEILKELFSSEGNVTSAKVIRRLDGKSKGFGFVEMETEEEASKAVEKYDQTSFKDRTIFVNEAKPRVNRNIGFEKRGGRFNNRNRDRDDLNSKMRKLRKKF